MLFKSLFSPIKSITSNLLDSNTSTSTVGGSTLAPLSLSSITNIISPTTVTNTVTSTVSSVTSGSLSPITGILGLVTGNSSPLSSVTSIVSGITGGTANPLDTVTGIVGSITGGTSSNPLDIVTGIVGGVTGGTGGNPLEAVTGIVGGITGGAGGNPLEVVTDIIGGVTGGAGSNPLEVVTDIIGGVTSGAGGNPLEVVTDIIGGITGGAGGNPLEVVTDIVGGITGGAGGNPLEVITGIVGGITGGDLGNNPVTGVIQTGIDVLQGVESLKTDIINTGINTVAGTVIGLVHQSEHPIGDLANLGTLTFETSRDTVNGTLEVISDLAGADLNGAIGSATGVIGTLINNGTTASNTIQHIVGDLTDIGSGGPLGAITDLIGGVTGGTGGNPLDIVTGIVGGITGGAGGNPLEVVTDIIGGVTGGAGGNPLDIVTGIVGGITGGDLGNNPVTGVIQTGIDVLQGVESLKTDIINTGINTVGGTLSGILPQVHPIVDLTNLGTLTFETSRDTVNGTLEVISDLAGADLNGAIGSATGVIETLINNGTTASNTIQHIVGDLTDIGSGGPLGAITDLIGGVTGGTGGNPLDIVTGIVGGITGGAGGNPLEVVTDIIGGITDGAGGNPLEVVTDIISGVTGGAGGNPLEVVTDIIGGVTGGTGGNPLDIVTGIVGGITGGDLGNNPVTGVIQTGIDVLQGVESLKTDIINTGINTVGGTLSGILPQVHPIVDLTNLGTLTFETSRDTVNGTLEAISDLAAADLSGVLGSATGVIGTLINNGSTAADILQHIANDFTTANPLDTVTGLIGSITGGVSGSPLGSIADVISNIGNGIDSGDVISGIAQPIQTVIGSANLAIDTVQDNFSSLISDSTFEGIDGLININAGNGDYSISGSVDGILNAITGAVSVTGIAVGETNPTGGSLTDLISLPSQLTSLTDNLFGSINNF
ncbi:beta strand repeat-containing protein [Acinetobacter beijerinckii]|uniref:beta strand repeat-containing protein n=1 Tax=Acinetobacter beijerinckii TaxID=262668 RepID=UPI003AF9F7BE